MSMCCFCSFAVFGTRIQETNPIEGNVKVLVSNQNKLGRQVAKLSDDVARLEADIKVLSGQRDSLQSKIDSLNKVTQSLAATQFSDKSTLNKKIDDNKSASQSAISSRTWWGIIVAVVVILFLAIAVILILKRIKRGDSSIEATIGEVRKAQDSLQSAQTKLQEDSVKLDNQLLEIVDKQLKMLEKEKSVKDNSKPDHSLVVKLADDLARIETNLSKMDKSVRGYKQLVQAKDRMINNVRAYGYEIISLIGQEYNDGMQFQARFVPDDTLPEGKRVITGMIKMQVNYNGKMIQPAEIVVSQNI